MVGKKNSKKLEKIAKTPRFIAKKRVKSKKNPNIRIYPNRHGMAKSYN